MLISGGLLLFPRLPLLVLVIVLGLAASGFRMVPLRRLGPACLVLGAVLLAALVRPGPVHLESLAIRFANFLGAMVLLNAYLHAPSGALSRDLFAILRWMAAQALLTVLLAHAASFLFMPISVAGGDYQTLLLLFNYHNTIEDAGWLIRPDGFFFEPGVFQIYLNLYLYLALFVFRKKGHSLLATLAVLSTQSTTGVLICMLLLGTALCQRLAVGSIRRRLIALLVAAVAGAPVAYLGYQNVDEKLFGEAQGSSWAREYDLFTGLNVIAEHPLLGIGFDHARYLAVSGAVAFTESQLSEEGMDDRASSNGLIYLTYSLGIPLALVFLAGLLRQRLFPHRVLIGVWLTLSLFGEAIIFTPFVLMFSLSAFVSSPRLAALRTNRAQRMPA